MTNRTTIIGDDIGLPKSEHDAILSGLTGEPQSIDVIVDACEILQKRLVEWGWPANRMIHGLAMEVLWGVYVAGERRGVAREKNDAAALFPVK